MTDRQKKGAVSAVDFWIKTKHIANDLMVIAGDNYFEFDLNDLIAEFNGIHALLAVHNFGSVKSVCELGEPCQLGLVFLDKNIFVRFDEKPLHPASSLVATGIYLLSKRIFPELSQYCCECNRDNLGNFASYLLHEDELRAYVFSDVWTDIGNELMCSSAAI